MVLMLLFPWAFLTVSETTLDRILSESPKPLFPSPPKRAIIFLPPIS
jgi:hypothetical protein